MTAVSDLIQETLGQNAASLEALSEMISAKVPFATKHYPINSENFRSGKGNQKEFDKAEVLGGKCHAAHKNTTGIG